MKNLKEEARIQYEFHMSNFEFFANCAKKAYREGNEKHYEFYVRKADEELFKIELLGILK